MYVGLFPRHSNNIEGGGVYFYKIFVVRQGTILVRKFAVCLLWKQESYRHEVPILSLRATISLSLYSRDHEPFMVIPPQ